MNEWDEMPIQFWLIPSPKRDRTHIKDYGKDAPFYYCGLSNSTYFDKLQGTLRKPEMKVCKNCLRVCKSRLGVEP